MGHAAFNFTRSETEQKRTIYLRDGNLYFAAKLLTQQAQFNPWKFNYGWSY